MNGRNGQTDLRNRRRQFRNNVKDIRNRNLSFANAFVDPKARIQSTTSASTEKSNIETYLKSYKDNSDNISATMRGAYIKNGLIARVIDYFQSIPTFNYSVFPLLGNKVYELDNSLEQDFVDVGYGIEQLGIKYFIPYFYKRVLLNGVGYFYQIQDTKGVEYLELPSEWCKISSRTNGVYNFMIDMRKFNEETIAEMPTEFQTAYQQYQSNSMDDEKKWYNSQYYIVSNKGVAFTLDQDTLNNGGVAISPFAGLLLDSLSMDQAKSNVEIQDTLDNMRLIHNKIPLNSDGKPTMEVTTAKIYDNQMRSRLPSGVEAVTSPMNVENIPLTQSGAANAYDTVNKSAQQVLKDFGVAGGMFGGDTTSANIVKASVQKDINWVYTNVLPMFENYYNEQLTLLKTKSKLTWHFKFIRQSNFTLKDDIATLKDQLTLGGSRLEYLAACGMSPIEIVSKLQFEQEVVDIDNIMVVKPTSNTLSSSQQNENTGRPVTDEPTDDTDRLQEEN